MIVPIALGAAVIALVLMSRSKTGQPQQLPPGPPKPPPAGGGMFPGGLPGDWTTQPSPVPGQIPRSVADAVNAGLRPSSPTHVIPPTGADWIRNSPILFQRAAPTAPAPGEYHTTPPLNTSNTSNNRDNEAVSNILHGT